MKFKNILPVVLGMLIFCSCSRNLETVPEINILQEEEYGIPIEDALTSLENFMIGEGMVMTKGGVNDYIDNYFPVCTPATKASSPKENVLYAVNFKNDGGYALLAADTRIQEDILALTDQGSVTDSDFSEPILERIPTDNDDLSESEYNAMVESGVLAALDKRINSECLKYATRKIDGDEYEKPRRAANTYSVTYEWKTVKEVPRMINTIWHQDSPFNKYCPNVGLIWRTKAPAGCVCIALSQIIAYHEFPANLTCNGMNIDYPEIKKIYYYNGSNPKTEETEMRKEMLARFCIVVGSWCKTKYHSIFGNAWGFAWPSDAKSCLEIFGYKNVSLNREYDESQVLQTLDNGCPVFVSAVSGCVDGHAWVIDGYMKRDYVSNTGAVSKSQTLVHCNWGWGGNCNGYFTSGVFKTQESETYDLSYGNIADHNFKYALNTITYDNPNK